VNFGVSSYLFFVFDHVLSLFVAFCHFLVTLFGRFCFWSLLIPFSLFLLPAKHRMFFRRHTSLKKKTQTQTQPRKTHTRTNTQTQTQAKNNNYNNKKNTKQKQKQTKRFGRGWIRTGDLSILSPLRCE